ncbi:ral-GDS-related protein-like [Manis pentadactyla]|uniref:ral-GDS-related protein-like n=1 Tax=Manis pentadactyla TaxID=143292 RepID=UPI00255C3ED7|nr:ral-GDS-related protein-like [Manis pentadactyla]
MGSQDRHAGSGRGRGRGLDRQGSAQRPGPHKGGPGGQCGWKDQASHSATPRPYPSCRMGQARRPAWEPEHVPCAIDASQLSSTLVGQVLHHLVQEEHLGPTVAELEEPRQTQLAPETRGGPASSPEPVQELPETPVLERRPVSPASAPAEPEDVPAVASAQGPGPELEPHEPSGLGPRALAGMAPGVAEPGPGPEPTGPCAASPWDIPGLVSGPELEPRESSGAGPVSPAGMAQGLAEPEVVLEPTSPCAVSTRDLPRERVRTILAFAPRLVAEQLTLMCAELYSRVECGECKVYVERQPLREAIVLLAPNILNVIRQFGTTFHWVISSCLRAPSRMAQDRARVVEFWIQVAKECLALRNFESFRAIIFALQRPPVRRLESTWAHVSCEDPGDRPPVRAGDGVASAAGLGPVAEQRRLVPWVL